MSRFRLLQNVYLNGQLGILARRDGDGTWTVLTESVTGTPIETAEGSRAVKTRTRYIVHTDIPEAQLTAITAGSSNQETPCLISTT